MPFHQDVHETIMQEYREQADYYEQFDSSYCDRACDQRSAIESAGYDCDCTPVDVLAADTDLSLTAAWVAEFGDEPFPT